MPIYEYVCEACGTEFEVMQKFSDPELKSHDCAPKAKVHRKLSLTAFHLQGGGWYASGYGNGSSGKNGSNGKSEAAPAKSNAGSTSTAASTGSTGGSESGGASKTEGVSAAGSCAGGCACH